MRTKIILIGLGIVALFFFMLPRKEVTKAAKAPALESEPSVKSNVKLNKVKPKFQLPFVAKPKMGRVYASPIPIDRADDITELSKSKDKETQALGDAWDAALMARMEEHYKETSECLRDFAVDKPKGDTREWVLYLEVVEGEVVEVWSPEWPFDFRTKEGGCFARAIEGARLEGLRDERRLLKIDIALVL